jgi:hypothetical protein
MHSPVSTKDPTAVEVEVQGAYLALFPEGDPLFVPRIFGWAIECFTGNYRDYQAVDTHYHDFEHTLQGTLCLARLLRGRERAGAAPRLTQRMFELGMLAILFHDSGYLKKHDDTEGTGAKYTVIHVDRSADFAAALLLEKGFRPEEARGVANMIRCTGVNARVEAIPFQSELERITGCALATADLLGQMAAVDYAEKLPVLYAEFAEAVRFTRDTSHFVASFRSAEDLVRRTPAFWEGVVLKKLDHDFQGLYRFLSNPYPSGPNDYLERVKANVERVRKNAAGVER